MIMFWAIQIISDVVCVMVGVIKTKKKFLLYLIPFIWVIDIIKAIWRLE